jgi:hypothetical protein
MSSNEEPWRHAFETTLGSELVLNFPGRRLVVLTVNWIHPLVSGVVISAMPFLTGGPARDSSLGRDESRVPHGRTRPAQREPTEVEKYISRDFTRREGNEAGESIPGMFR